MKILGSVFAVVALVSIGFASSAKAEAVVDGKKHAAIAHNGDTGRYGWAIDKDSQQAAETAAVKACGAGCTVRMHWNTGCGAFAVGEKDVHHFGWATRPTLDEAEKAALHDCEAKGAKCVIKEQKCN